MKQSSIRLGIVEPRDAFAAFERRRLLQPSFAWQDIWQDEHSRAFGVAGVMRLDILQSFRDALDTGLADGTALADFSKTMRSRLVEAGFWGDVEVTDPDSGETRVTRFDDRRLALIFDVNMRQSHAAGRWARIERNKRQFPYVLYRTMQDERVRASHRPWNGLALPVEHEFWKTHYPPNGWRCRCIAFAVDEQDLQRRRNRGEVIKTEAPPPIGIEYINKRTGEVSVVPRGIDPGFAHNPGMAARDQELVRAILAKAALAPPMEAAVAIDEIKRAWPQFEAAAVAQLGDFVDAVDQDRVKRRRLVMIGTIERRIVGALQERDVYIDSGAIAVRDEDVLHTLHPAATKAKPVEQQVSPAVYMQLPALLRRARAVIYDTSAETPALLYIVPTLHDGRVLKIVVPIYRKVRVHVADGSKPQVQLNAVRTVTEMNPQALVNEKKYELLSGSWPKDW